MKLNSLSHAWNNYLLHDFKKKISLILFYWLTKFHCLVVFTSWDIEQYVY